MDEAKRQYEAPRVLRLGTDSTVAGDSICDPNGSSATDVCWQSGLGAGVLCSADGSSADDSCENGPSATPQCYVGDQVT